MTRNAGGLGDQHGPPAFGLFLVSTLFLLFVLAVFPATAVEPREMLPDPALEARALDVSRQIRCVVCQNQSIDDSDAELAHDMRVLVRRRILSGDSNEQVVQYLVDRYGDFVTLRPPFKATTAVLWIAPFLFLGAAILAARGFLRRRMAVGGMADDVKAAPPPLSAAERMRLAALLQKDDDRP